MRSEPLAYIRGGLWATLENVQNALFEAIQRELDRRRSLYEIPALVAEAIFDYRKIHAQADVNYPQNAEGKREKILQQWEKDKERNELSNNIASTIQHTIRTEARLLRQLAAVIGTSPSAMASEVSHQMASWEYCDWLNLPDTAAFGEAQGEPGIKLFWQKRLLASVALDVGSAIAFMVYERGYGLPQQDIFILYVFLQENSVDYLSFLTILANQIALGRMESLEANWDEDGAEAISPAALEAASSLLWSGSLEINRLVMGQGSLHVFPMRAGGVQFEIDGLAHPIEIEIHPDGDKEMIMYDNEGTILKRETFKELSPFFQQP